MIIYQASQEKKNVTKAMFEPGLLAPDRSECLSFGQVSVLVVLAMVRVEASCTTSKAAGATAVVRG